MVNVSGHLCVHQCTNVAITRTKYTTTYIPDHTTVFMWILNNDHFQVNCTLRRFTLDCIDKGYVYRLAQAGFGKTDHCGGSHSGAKDIENEDRRVY